MTPTPSCPCCHDAVVRLTVPSDEWNCSACGCRWFQSARRAQPTPPMDEAAEREAFDTWQKQEMMFTHNKTEPTGHRKTFPQVAWEAWFARAKVGKAA